MTDLNLRSQTECLIHQVKLGELMLRLDPGDGRIKNARRFQVWEGGGEYNVARGLRKCFGLRTAVATALPDNDVGRLVEDFILQGGVDTRLIKWRKFDGIGAANRVGLNFTERGYGIRGALGVSDRAHSAAAQLARGEIDWEHLFGTLGVRWLHTGGIFAALSPTTPEVVEEALQCARRHGTIISYDLNYRPSLWQAFGGLEACRATNRRLARYVDVMIGNEEDYHACLGLEVKGTDAQLKVLPIDSFKRMISAAVEQFPNFKVCANTLRLVASATVNDWSAICWHNGNFYQAQEFKDLLIYDRVGGGDSFASGLIYGLMRYQDPQKAVDYGCAHGALAMTTPGDTSMASLAEVERVVAGGGARVQR